MKIGIIGSGRLGTGLGQRWARAGHEVFHGSGRGVAGAPHSPAGTSGSLAEAAAFGEVLVLAVPRGDVAEALAAAGSLVGKVIVDPTGEATALAPGARVVRAFDDLRWTFPSADEPRGDCTSVPYATDHPEAKDRLIRLIADLGRRAEDASANTARLRLPIYLPVSA